MMPHFTGCKGVLSFEAEGNIVSIQLNVSKLPEGDDEMALKIAQEIVKTIRIPTQEAEKKDKEMLAEVERTKAKVKELQEKIDKLQAKPQEEPKPVKMAEEPTPVEHEEKQRRGRR